jgi:hypothetical protein
LKKGDKLEKHAKATQETQLVKVTSRHTLEGKVLNCSFYNNHHLSYRWILIKSRKLEEPFAGDMQIAQISEKYSTFGMQIQKVN